NGKQGNSVSYDSSWSCITASGEDKCRMRRKNIRRTQDPESQIGGYGHMISTFSFIMAHLFADSEGSLHSSDEASMIAMHDLFNVL
ncbi:mCG144963, partial [Mus musculus]